ncbi:hypothetical protein KKG29_05345 [Patescibacteria group bacterium]|nr:hypothetical protein [Patescibacteria group bacterium]MBU4057313.1 hypothetical protein [Patescibacteria group bacterium]
MHEDNKPFYSYGYQINKADKQDPYNGTILLDGIIADVGKISISNDTTIVGSVINLRFSKPLTTNDSRAVRFRYCCDRITQKKPDGSYSLFLEYYSSKSAALLNIEQAQAVSIETLFIWLTFPVNTEDIYNPSPPFKRRAITRSIMKEYGVIYGPGFDQVIDEGPHRPVAFWKPFDENNKFGISPWDSTYFYCEYILHKPEIKTKPILENQLIHQYFTTEYNTTIKVGQKGEPRIILIVNDSHPIRLSPLHSHLFLIMVLKLKNEWGLKDPLEVGWVSFDDFIEKVPSWKQKSYEIPDTTIISEIYRLNRELAKKLKLPKDKDLVANGNPKPFRMPRHYRLRVHPDLISWAK